MIGGSDIIVICDESLFGKRKYNRVLAKKPIWVVGFVERTNSHNIIFYTVKKSDKKTLTTL